MGWRIVERDILYFFISFFFYDGFWRVVFNLGKDDLEIERSLLDSK